VTPQLFASKFAEFGQNFPPKKLQSPSHALFLCYQVTKLVAKKNIDCNPFGYKKNLTYNLELLHLFTNKMFLHFTIARFKNHKDLTQHIFRS
jgi:hypothetical protein